MVPNVQAMTGPIMGDTSILATIETVLFVARPMAAMTEATLRSMR
jgi:hypothetical protein